MKYVLAISVVCAFSQPQFAVAQSSNDIRPRGASAVSGIYVAGGAGINWAKDSADPIGLDPTAFPLNDSLLTQDAETGGLFVGSIGWGFGNGVRLELEAGYRKSSIDNPLLRTFDSNSDASFGRGTLSTTSAMVNAMYDIGAAQAWPVQLTLGAGIGYARQSRDIFSTAYPPFWDEVRFNDSTGSFAWQAIGGLTIPLQFMPGMALTLEYRYFQTQDRNLQGGYIVNAGQGNTLVSPASLRIDNSDQSVLLGLRYSFQ